MTADLHSSRSRISWKILVIGFLITLPLVWALVRGLSLDPRRMDAPLVNKPAPSFALNRLSDGEPMSLASLRGKPIVLNFWATWCIPCRTEHPLLVQAEQLFGKRFQFVGIVYQDRNEVVEAWLERFGGHTYPTLIDISGKAAIAYGVYGVPETYFIDAAGIVRAKHVGPLTFPALREYLEMIQP